MANLLDKKASENWEIEQDNKYSSIDMQFYIDLCIQKMCVYFEVRECLWFEN